MDEKQTRCPNCASVYKVSVTQLTVAQGMVCCPKCSHNFNALLYLQKNSTADVDTEVTHPLVQEAQAPVTTQRMIESTIFDIFKRKAENSNIDLKTYLNNLNYFNNEPVNSIPSLNLSQGIKDHSNPQAKTKSLTYYLIWSFVNIILFFILVFQILWFNPNVLDRYEFLNTFFTRTCSILHCQTIDQRYTQIKIENLKVVSVNQRQTQFSGQLNNTYSKSLELPHIKVTLKAQNTIVESYVMTPDEYLIESLQGIKRIPQNSPYPFKFLVEQPRKSFDQYELVIIHP